MGGFNFDMSGLNPAFNAMLSNYQRFSDVAVTGASERIKRENDMARLERERAQHQMRTMDQGRRDAQASEEQRRKDAENERLRMQNEKRAFINSRSQQMRDLHGTYSRTAQPYGGGGDTAEGLSEWYGRGMPHAQAGGAMGGGSSVGLAPSDVAGPSGSDRRSPMDMQYDSAREDEKARRAPTAPVYNMYLPSMYGGY